MVSKLTAKQLLVDAKGKEFRTKLTEIMNKLPEYIVTVSNGTIATISDSTVYTNTTIKIYIATCM